MPKRGVLDGNRMTTTSGEQERNKGEGWKCLGHGNQNNEKVRKEPRCTNTYHVPGIILLNHLI